MALTRLTVKSLKPHSIYTDKIDIYKNCTIIIAFGYTTFLSVGKIYNSRVLILKFLIYEIKGIIYMIKLITYQPHPTYN